MGWNSPTLILLHPHPARQHWMSLAMMQWVAAEPQLVKEQ